MNSALIVVLLATVMLACSAEPNTESQCSKLPKVSHDARKTIEPYGDNWMMVKSTVPNQRCTRLEYHGNLNDNQNSFSALFVNKETASTLNGMGVVNKKMNKWTVLLFKTRKTFVYRKLFINNKKHAFCIYVCNPSQDDDTIAVFQCFALNDEGMTEINNELKNRFPNLKFMKDVKVHDSFPKDCKVKNKIENFKEC